MYRKVTQGFKNAVMVPSNGVYDYIKTKNNTLDWYYSPILYTKDQYEEFKKTNSVAGFSDTITDQLWWDFDCIDQEQARQSTIETVKRLKKHGFKNENIQIKFSGNKGFHILIDTDKKMTNKEVQAICTKVAGDLEGFDNSVYLSSQLLRIPLTKNKKSNLFSIPLLYSELLDNNVEWIKYQAKKVDDIKEELDGLTDYYQRIKLPKDVYEYKDLAPVVELKTKKEENNLSFDLSTIDWSVKPPFLDNAKWALFNGLFRGSETKQVGERNPALLCLAATYKNIGFHKEITYRLLKGVAELQAQRTGESRFSDKELYNNIIAQVYNTTWKGGQYSVKDPTSWLYKYAKDYKIPLDNDLEEESRVLDISDSFSAFKTYAKSIDDNTIKFGIKALDEILHVQTGHLIGLLAGPGLGKTSCALTLLNNTSKDGVSSFFASYDMAQNILIQKLVQRETKYTREELYDFFRNNDKKAIEEMHKKLQENYENVTFNFKSGQTLEQLKYDIVSTERKTGKMCRLVVVDYLELVQTKASDPTMASAEAIQGLREIANDGRVVLVLLQPNKMNSKPDEPMRSYNAAKGSSAIAQAVTAMITCHRPGYSSEFPEHDKYFSIDIVKNRMGSLGCADFSWDGPTGRIRDLTIPEKHNLERLREKKRLEKEDEKKNGGF